MTFWDFCAPFYDKAERTNTAYVGMLRLIRDLVPKNSNVFEAAAGTGSISVEVADKARTVYCTDVSQRMLSVARRKAKKKGIDNIAFEISNIFETGIKENTYDVVIASQVLHLIDEPEKAADELKRISKGKVITAVTLLKDLRGFFVRPSVGIWKILGFAPKREFNAESYFEFLCDI